MLAKFTIRMAHSTARRAIAQVRERRMGRETDGKTRVEESKIEKMTVSKEPKAKS